MSKRIAIINPIVFDIGGTTTLCNQYSKLGIDCWLMTDTIPFKSNFHVNTYSTVTDLIDAVDKYEYDRLLFLNMWYGKRTSTDAINELKLLRKVYPNLELCHINCSRTMDHLYDVQTECRKNEFVFDYVFSIRKDVSGFDLCDCVYLNINAYTPVSYEPVSYSERKKIIFTSGRVESFKGIVKYFNSVDESFIKNSKEFIYVHEGASYNWNKNNTISCPPQLLNLFDATVRPKVLKPYFLFRKYGELPVNGKFNIYPKYELETAQNRWKYFYAGVCCIGGTSSGYTTKNSLLGNKYVIKDTRERTFLENQRTRWNDALEYADIEKIMSGVPTLFSRQYSERIGFSDERLIYDSFSDITNKVEQLKNCYDIVRESQYEWFMTKNKNTNDYIIEQFTKDFGDVYE